MEKYIDLCELKRQLQMKRVRHADVATMLGMDRTNITHMLNGNVSMRAEDFIKIIYTYNLDESEIIKRPIK